MAVARCSVLGVRDPESSKLDPGFAGGADGRIGTGGEDLIAEQTPPMAFGQANLVTDTWQVDMTF